MYLETSHIFLLVVLWILLQPGALFTIDLQERSLKFSLAHFFAQVAPHFLLLVLIWALSSYALYKYRETYAGPDDVIEPNSTSTDQQQPSSDGAEADDGSMSPDPSQK